MKELAEYFEANDRFILFSFGLGGFIGGKRALYDPGFYLGAIRRQNALRDPPRCIQNQK
jgi:hypothetical protein